MITPKYNLKIANWLEQHGVDVESISNGDGMSFEELMYGNDVPDELCRRIEKLFYAEVQKCGSNSSCAIIVKSSMNAKDQVAIVEKWSAEDTAEQVLRAVIQRQP